MVDFSFHYIDYNNEYFLNTILKDSVEDKVNLYNYDLSFIIMFKSLLFYILFFFCDIVIILIQIIFSIFKLVIAFYLLWLIVDLFILKVLFFKESSRLRKKN